MTLEERFIPPSEKPQLRSNNIYIVFGNLCELFQKTHPGYYFNGEDDTRHWNARESGFDLEIEHEVGWSGGGQTLSLRLPKPPHMPSLSQKMLIIDLHYSGYGADSVTNERVRLIERADDVTVSDRDATDEDILEFETICSFLEASELERIRKTKIRDALASRAPLSEILRQLETSEAALFASMDFDE